MRFAAPPSSVPTSTLPFRLPLWAALLVAAASGPIMDAGFPDKGWWPLTFIGVGLFLYTLIGRRVRASLLLGFIGGAGFYFTHIEWASRFLGPVPMAALSILESLFYMLGAMAIALAYRWLPRVFPTLVGRLLLLPVVVAGLWTAREAWASVWPYGGFAWGRVSLSQSESPINGLFSWLGVSGVSFVMVFTIALAVEIIRLPGAMQKLRGSTLVVAVLAGAFVFPSFQLSNTGSMTVAAVQGNGKASYFDTTRKYGDLLNAQWNATLPLIADKEDVDVVIWPESGTDIDPLANQSAADVLDYLSSELDAPVVTGAITERGEELFNSSLLWEAGEGAEDIYDKRHPVPFGEYVPDREFWEPFAPDLIGMIGREYRPGTTDAVFDVRGVLAGINICFDIVDDQLMTDSINEGAQIMFAQSNNADFGFSADDYTDEGVQQLAIARVRALELGRTVVNVSTVGTSAIIGPDGETINQLPVYEAATMVNSVPLSDTVTPAVVFGRHIEWFVSWIGGAALLVSALALRKRRVPRLRK